MANRLTETRRPKPLPAPNSDFYRFAEKLGELLLGLIRLRSQQAQALEAKTRCLRIECHDKSIASCGDRGWRVRRTGRRTGPGNAPVRVTPNLHFFQPLLYQVASDTKVFAPYHRLIVSCARIWSYRFMASDQTFATIAAMSRNNFIMQSRGHRQS